ncbi:MAG: hypothetical protein JO146_08705 [Candidatus Eremiobacteraeota bacterium]|nr:hypothetical protein [Candidatus Eremiobacteraeota bacterium]
MRPLAAASVLIALGATAAPPTVTVSPSNISFRSALEACSGSLAGISLSLGHVRVAEAQGVDTDVDDANPSAQTITLTSGSKMATVTVNAHKSTVTAKHVTLASRNRVACVAPD